MRRHLLALTLLAAALLSAHMALVPGPGGAQEARAVADLFSGAPQSVLSASGGWSWFEGPRAQLTDCELLVGSVATGATADGWSRAGDIDVITRSLSDGTVRVDTLAEGLEQDDHDSPAILDLPGGRVLAGYTRHNRDGLLRSSWRALGVRHWTPAPTVSHPGQQVTYSNLVHLSDDGGGQAALYNFYRGAGAAVARDPNALRSTDLGAIWQRQGPLLHLPGQRPYVRYADDGVSRVDLAFSDGHPGEKLDGTSIFHAYAQGQYVYDTTGGVLGRVGASIDPGELEPIYAGDADHRAWIIDLVQGPAGPVVVFSVRDLSTGVPNLERNTYWYATWDGATWQTHKIAWAGSALYPNEAFYTGGVAVDPGDPSHVVLSTDVHPDTGAPLGNHELFDGVTADGGATWTFSAITTSAADDIRPVIAEPTETAHALVWMSGRYTTYRDYATEVRAIVEGGPDGHCAPPAYAPGPHPFSGDFDADGKLDYFHYQPGSAPDTVFWGDGDRTTANVNGTFTPIPVRYADQTRSTSILWSNPSGTSYRWDAVGHTFQSRVAPVARGVTPVVGDFNGDGKDDLLHYRPGSAGDMLQISSGRTYTSRSVAVSGTYVPLAGDLTGDGIDDIFWYRPGSQIDPIWIFNASAAATSRAAQVLGTYSPSIGDLDGNGTDDIVWTSATGAGYRWSFTPGAEPVAVGSPVG
jgi:hypothetical protein